MSQKKHKKTETKVKDPNFIRFTKLQSTYLDELYTRHMKERDGALTLVYKELGITEKVLQSPPGTYQLRQDLSGLDVLPSPRKPDPPASNPHDPPTDPPAPNPTKDDKPPPPPEE